MLEIDNHPELLRDSNDEVRSLKGDSFMSRVVGKAAAMLMAAIVPTAHAQETVDWINLATTEAGIHEITYEAMAADGIDLEGLFADEISLVNAGESVPVQVTGGDTFGPGSSIVFVAEQIDTLYTNRNIYTVRSGGVAPRMVDESTFYPVRAPFATSYLGSTKYAPQNRYSFTSPDESDPWFAMRMLATNSPVTETVSVRLDDVAVGGNSGSTRAKMSVNVWGASDLPGSNDHRVQIGINQVTLMDERFSGLNEKSFEMDLDESFILEGGNEVEITLPTQDGFSFDAINVNEIEVKYPRKFIAQDNRLSFPSQFNKFRIRGFEATGTDENGRPDLDVIVLREKDGELVNVDNARVFCRNGCTVDFGGSGELANYYVSANPHVPETQALVVPEDITSGNARYLIISHPDFIGSAGNNQLEQLANDLQSEMGSADIVDVEQIYAQYGGHVFDPTAIKRYISFAHANRGTRYVLLVGGDVYDYRQFENENASSFIPSLYAATGSNISFAPVDPKYVDLDDDNVPDMPIGRLPVRTTAQLTQLLNKRQAYNNRSYSGSALMVADAFDEIQQYDFAQDANRVASRYLSNFQISTAYVDDLGTRNARNTLTNRINQGVTLTAFFGHSSTNQWSFNGLLTGNDAARLNNVGRPTVVTQWGCWNAYYVSPNEDSMGHRFLMEGEQGAVAVMGATTLTDANAERELAELVFMRLSQGERLGDAVTNAKQEFARENPDHLDVLLGWTILGSPELLVN